MTKTAPRLYVACLASYNNGVLHGRWVDVGQDVDCVRSEIAAILRESPYPNVKVDCPECDGAGCNECGDTGKVASAEEWAVHDHEGFGEIHLGENPDLDEVAALAAAIEEHGEPFLAWAANDDGNRDPDDFQEHFAASSTTWRIMSLTIGSKPAGSPKRTTASGGIPPVTSTGKGWPATSN